MHCCHALDIFAIIMMQQSGDEVWDDVSSSLSLMISERSVDDLPEGLLEVLGMNQSEDNSELELDQVQDAVEEILEKLRSKSQRSVYCITTNVLS